MVESILSLIILIHGPHTPMWLFQSRQVWFGFGSRVEWLHKVGRDRWVCSKGHL